MINENCKKDSHFSLVPNLSEISTPRTTFLPKSPKAYSLSLKLLHPNSLEGNPNLQKNTHAVAQYPLYSHVVLNLCTWYVQRFMRRCIFKKIYYLTLTLVSRSNKMLPSSLYIMWPIHMLQVKCKFEFATSNGLGEDTRTRNVRDGCVHGLIAG